MTAALTNPNTTPKAAKDLAAGDVVRRGDGNWGIVQRPPTARTSHTDAVQLVDVEFENDDIAVYLPSAEVETLAPVDAYTPNAARALTVRQMIYQLLQQVDHGRGDYELSVRYMGKPVNLSPVLVSGLPTESGDKVAVFAIRQH